MPERGLLGDETSVRVAEHKRLRMPEVIRQGDTVVGELLHRDRFERGPTVRCHDGRRGSAAASSAAGAGT